MARQQKCGIVIAVIACVSMSLTACTMRSAGSQLVHSSPPPATADIAPFSPSPGGGSFYSERAETGAPTSPIRYENRLLTNLSRHTFSNEGRDFDPDMHPDGRTLVFASTRNSNRPDIFLKGVDGFAITQLTSDPSDDVQPRYSPDGERLVFCSNRSGNWDVWMINRDGTGLTQLTSGRTDEVAPCWAPDGQRIAFTIWGQRSSQWEIWTLSTGQPGTRRFLGYGMFPDWSPDGSRIAFQRARQRGSRWFSVWVIDLVGDEARHPTELAYSETTACVAPRWSPDGKSLVYCTVRDIGEPDAEDLVSDVWVVDATTGVRMRKTDGGATAFNPVWSPDGRVYFVSARSGVENIWSMAVDPADDMPATARTAVAGEVAVNQALSTGGN